MTIYAYKRCSTNEDKQDVSRQLYGKTFEETVIEYASGKNEKGRPLFQELKSKLVAGDELHFNDLSRAGRNTKELLSTVEDLVERGVKVVFHSENLTFVSDEQDPMAGAMSKMLLTMLASVNELFLTQTRIAVKQGLERVRKESPEKLAKGENSQWRKSFNDNRENHISKRNNDKAHENNQPVVEAVKKMIKYSSNMLNLVQIAENLTQEGYTTPRGKQYTKASVSRLIKTYNIDYICKTR